jgi:hypothetical protein
MLIASACLHRYLSTAIPLLQGEVAHLTQQRISLPRPTTALGLITKYSVDMLEQTSTELRPALRSSLHLKQAAFFQRINVTGQSTSSPSQECVQPLMVAAEGGRGLQVIFPHPFGILSDRTDSWEAELHVVRMDDLRVDGWQAMQCACMRPDVGSRHCCPHSCRFPTTAAGAPVMFRLSLTLTWLLGAKDSPEANADSSMLHPLSTMWLPVAVLGGSRESSAPSCHTAQPESEFDMPTCRTMSRKQCEIQLSGSWVTHARAGVMVAALAMPSFRTAQMVLRARGEGREDQPCERSSPSSQHLGYHWVSEPCVFGDSGKLFTAGSAFQAEASLNATEPILGADAGFFVWVAYR